MGRDRLALLGIKYSYCSIEQCLMVLLEIMARKRDVGVGLRRIAL